MYSLFVAIWLHTLKTSILFPGECPRRFFGSHSEILHTSSMCPCEVLTRCVCALYLPHFLPVEIFRKKWTTLAEIYSARAKINSVRPRDGACIHTTQVQNLRIYLLTTAWTFGFLSVKMSQVYVISFNWLDYGASCSFFALYCSMLTQAGQIFDFLCENFYRHALEYSRPRLKDANLKSTPRHKDDIVLWSKVPHRYITSLWGVALLSYGAPKITAVVHLQSCTESGLLLLTLLRAGIERFLSSASADGANPNPNPNRALVHSSNSSQA